MAKKTPTLVALKTRKAVRRFNNVDITVERGGVIRPVPTIRARTHDPVYWTFRNRSGETATAAVEWFRNAVTKRSSAPVAWFPTINAAQLRNGEVDAIGGVVTHVSRKRAGSRRRTKSHFEYAILVQLGRHRAILYDPDLEVLPPSL